jgi:hypothetical protein
MSKLSQHSSVFRAISLEQFVAKSMGQAEHRFDLREDQRFLKQSFSKKVKKQ